MIVFPAIDLLSGRVVRLKRGQRDQVDVYSEDPVAQARAFAAQGASWVHVVDLSAAFGEDDEARAANDAAIRGICQVEGISVDVGGGVHSLARIEELASYGCKRIALGTALVRDPAFAEQAAQTFGEMLVADVASRNGQVSVNGWRDGTGIPVDSFVASLAERGFRHLVYTDADRDGMQTGIDTGAYERIASSAGFPVVASGGVASLDDIKALAALPCHVIEGVICGRALYEGAFSLSEALAVAAGSPQPAPQRAGFPQAESPSSPLGAEDSANASSSKEDPAC
jgi:phosphoribosylformimino-5-aminoimidazole carboxamide ribotide isomerase